MLIGNNWNLSKIGGLFALRINSGPIRRVHKAKYLGLVINDKLSWKEHIGYISTKSRRNMGMMKRIKDCIHRDSLILLYRTLVEPYFRYCDTTWRNHETSLLNKLQTLQNRAAWVITGIKYDKVDHSSMLKDLNILNVHQLIKLDAVSIIYQTENGLVPDKVKTWFNKCSRVHCCNNRAAVEGNFVIRKMRTEKSKRAFIVSGTKLRNEIPDSVKKVPANRIFS